MTKYPTKATEGRRYVFLCLLACFLVYLLACLFVCLLELQTGLLTCSLACVHACMLAFLLVFVHKSRRYRPSWEGSHGSRSMKHWITESTVRKQRDECSHQTNFLFPFFLQPGPQLTPKVVPSLSHSGNTLTNTLPR